MALGQEHGYDDLHADNDESVDDDLHADNDETMDDDLHADIDEPLDGAGLDVSLDVSSETTVCAICGKTYSNKRNLQRHLKSHNLDYAFKCTRCTVYFTTQEQLNAHDQAKHFEKTHLCTYCGKYFMTKGTLISHSSRIHGESSNKTTIKCPYDKCNIIFFQKEKYQDHINGHSGVKPHTCSKCARQFHGRYYKNNHERICTGITQFKCDNCGLDFCDKSSLKA